MPQNCKRKWSTLTWTTPIWNSAICTEASFGLHHLDYPPTTIWTNFPSPNGGSPSPNRISPTGSFRVVQLGLIRMGVDHENNFWQVQMTLTICLHWFWVYFVTKFLSHDIPFSQWKIDSPIFFPPSAWSPFLIVVLTSPETQSPERTAHRWHWFRKMPHH